ncbi:MAG TPA: class I SAM-dependent methyltransferase, partial [Cryomorphaceae bacterium]|nr:class I SAM-dependent methyltransferase [Cryomorphaceae bacterium]
EELRPLVVRYLEKAGLTDVVNLHYGRASVVLNNLQGPYDLVFIDADKSNYVAYYDAVIDKVSPGGIIIADNVLWSGKVLDGTDDSADDDTRTLREYNQKVLADDRVDNVLLPIRDGLMVARKK